MKKFIYTLSLITILACSSSDDNIVETPTGNLMTATVNGRNFAASDELVNATVTFSNFVNIFVVTGAYAESNQGEARSQSIGLVLAFQEQTDFSTGSSWTTTTVQEGEGIEGQYIEAIGTVSNADGFIASTDAPNGVASFRITALDTSAQTLSAEFSFTAFDEDDGNTYQITNGQLNNVSYTIEQ